MTTGNVLYLALAIGMFVVFSIALAYVSWIQSSMGPDVAAIPDPADRHAEPPGALRA